MSISSDVDHSNPFEVIRLLNNVVSDQRIQIQEFQLALNSIQKQKQILLVEKKRLELVVDQLLARIEILKSSRNQQTLAFKNNHSITSLKIGLNSTLPKSLLNSPNRKFELRNATRPSERLEIKTNFIDSKDCLSNPSIAKKNEQSLKGQQDFLPPPIRLNVNCKTQNSMSSILNITLENFYKKEHIYGQNLLQTFVVIGPEIADFKKKRSAERGKDEINVKSAPLYCHTKFYRQNKIQFLTQIAKRAFPEGCKLKRKLFEHNEELISLIEYKPSRLLSQDYFIFTLKGDESLQKAGVKKSYLYITNPNYFLFVVCLKLPDFMYVREEKNYLRKENEIWVGQKIYAMVTYYPFFNVHTQLLYRIHSIISKIMIRKILIENENILTWSMAKTIYDVEKNEEVNETLAYFLNKRPDYNQVCYHSTYYFGTLPQFGFKSEYSVSLFCCPVFFSNFAYQEMLLMLAAIFCQKTLIFISKVEAVATLSALFLINLISPFQFSSPLMLNCDSQKVKEMIFEFPFPMVCSIKKSEDNIDEILELFVESNLMRLKEDDAQYVVIDVDSNTILYHHALDKLFNDCITQPSKQVRQAYLAVNSCESKSFSLPKELARENVKQAGKPKSDIEKRYEQKKKAVKEYLEKIATNQTKLPTYRCNERYQHLLELLTGYVKQYTLDNQSDYEVVKHLETAPKNNRIEIVRSYLLEKNKNRVNIVNKFLESQMFANYLDSILLHN